MRVPTRDGAAGAKSPNAARRMEWSEWPWPLKLSLLAVMLAASLLALWPRRR